jgi:DNA-binding NarL/FixJ family response regulator
MTVLYIDNDPDGVEIFCLAMESVDPSLKCFTAPNAKEAFKSIHKICPDFLFIDYDMMNELETLPTLREWFKKTRVIVFSTYMTALEAKYCNDLGAYMCFRKSKTLQGACNTLNALLNPKPAAKIIFKGR